MKLTVCSIRSTISKAHLERKHSVYCKSGQSPSQSLRRGSWERVSKINFLTKLNQPDLCVSVTLTHRQRHTDLLRAAMAEWLYLTRVHADNARCNKCCKSFACKGRNTKCTVTDSLALLFPLLPQVCYTSRSYHTELIKSKRHELIAFSNRV